MLRKHIIPGPAHETPTSGTALYPDGKDIPSLATVLVTSEAPGSPVDHLFDTHDGPGGTRWMAASDGEQTIILAFDTPQSIREVGLETEELRTSRTQVLTLSLSRDGGKSYR